MAPAAPAAATPNACRISRSLEDVSAWAVGYIYSDTCLIPERSWSSLGASDRAISQVVDSGEGKGEGMDNGGMGRTSHKVQVLCVE